MRPNTVLPQVRSVPRPQHRFPQVGILFQKRLRHDLDSFVRLHEQLVLQVHSIAHLPVHHAQIVLRNPPAHPIATSESPGVAFSTTLRVHKEMRGGHTCS